MAKKFKVGDRVIGLKSASKVYGTTVEGYEAVVDRVKGKEITINGFEVEAKHFKKISSKPNIEKVMKPKKAKFKIGDKVYNQNESQRSSVVAVHWDTENEENAYVVKCLEDDGSIHIALEEDLSVPEIVKMTLGELKEYYYEQEGSEVEIVK